MDKGGILKSASQNDNSLIQISTNLCLPATSKRVRQISSSLQNLRWSRMKAAPKLTYRHKQLHLEYFDKYVKMGQKWKNVLFSDVKLFDANGPNGLK